MNRTQIKAMQREIRYRPYKRAYREVMAGIRTLGANVLIVMTMIFSGWLILIAQG